MVSIAKHDNLISFLNNLFDQKKQRNDLFSLRAWARLLGYNSPSYLVQVLKGERKANLKLITSICRTEQFNPADEKYFKLLYMKHSVDVDEDDDIFNSLFHSLRPDSVPSHDFLAKFNCFSSWIPFYIVELTKVKGELTTRENIVSLLSSFLDDDSVHSLLDELVEVGLLKEEDGFFKRSVVGEISFDPVTENAAVRLFHSSSLKRAATVLKGQDREIRDIRSTMVAIDSSDYGIACEIIREAHKKISALASQSGNADQVYQFNSQFYMPVALPKTDKE